MVGRSTPSGFRKEQVPRRNKANRAPAPVTLFSINRFVKKKSVDGNSVVYIRRLWCNGMAFRVVRAAASRRLQIGAGSSKDLAKPMQFRSSSYHNEHETLITKLSFRNRIPGWFQRRGGSRSSVQILLPRLGPAISRTDLENQLRFFQPISSFIGPTKDEARVHKKEIQSIAVELRPEKSSSVKSPACLAAIILSDMVLFSNGKL